LVTRSKGSAGEDRAPTRNKRPEEASVPFPLITGKPAIRWIVSSAPSG
jgi:hypothetical protein